MDHSVSQPVYISTVANDLENEQCLYDAEDWLELEQFWGSAKNRIQEVDGRAISILSSSLEKHLLNDDFLEDPESHLKQDELPLIVRGKDIPTTYAVSGFRPQEFIAIGTFVDQGILPGFRYRVRKNLTEEYLFDGKAKYLESVGLGYGKRLTFVGESLNENDNYFWSDSRVHGYGFLLQSVEKEDVFSILDTKTKSVIGRVVVSDPCVSDDIVLNTTVGEQGYIEKEVRVNFRCNVIIKDSTNLSLENITLLGNAVLVRESFSAQAKISQIKPTDFIVDSCFLYPEE